MRVLVVDDDPIAVKLLARTLTRAGYDVAAASDGLQAMEHMASGDIRMVVSDWLMPGMSGVELCRQIRRNPNSGYVYFILVTTRSGTQNIVEGLEAGADDFVSKPFDPTELCMRLRTGERILSLDSREITIFALAKLADSRDRETGEHLERMREYSRVLARHLATLDKYRDIIDGEFISAIYRTSPLHDIGKVGIPDRILCKPGRLTAEEFDVMKTHTTIGADTLDAALRQHPEARFLQLARDIALTHHERYDGTGYPHGLAGEQIPLCGRIVALADVYDALTSERVYKPAYTHEEARAIIVEERGRHFDPDLVDAFIAHQGYFLALSEALKGKGTLPINDNEWQPGSLLAEPSFA